MQEIYIPPEKRQEILDELRFFLDIVKKANVKKL